MVKERATVGITLAQSSAFEVVPDVNMTCVVPRLDYNVLDNTQCPRGPFRSVTERICKKQNECDVSKQMHVCCVLYTLILK